MSKILHLRPETSDALAALANTNGMSVEDYLQELVDRERLNQPGLVSQPVRPIRLTPEDWARQFEGMGDSFPDAPPIPDEALSRESLYPDRC